MKIKIIALTLALISIAPNLFADKIYSIRKLRVGGNGSGTYMFINQGSWHTTQRGQHHSVTISCTDPGPSPCRVTSWPTANQIPQQWEQIVRQDFMDFIALKDTQDDSGIFADEQLQTIYGSGENSVHVLFTATMLGDELLYELEIL